MNIILLLMVISTVVAACSYNGRILKQDDTSVVENPAVQGGQSDVEGLPAEKIKSNTFEEVKPRDGNSVESLIPSAPRSFIDVFYGTVTTLDNNVSASSNGIVCVSPCTGPASSVSRTVQFHPSALYGIRVGNWFENYPYFGIAGDVSYLQGSAPGVRIQYVPISFVMMGRYPFFRTDKVPDGRLQFYGGAMVSLGVGILEVEFTPDMRTSVGGYSDGHGVGALGGIAWHLPSYALFFEFRITRDWLHFKQNSIWGPGPDSANVELASRQMVFGVSYKY
jgi:hypothetical protein